MKLTNVAVDFIVIDRVVRIIVLIVVAGVVIVLILLDLSLLRNVVGVWRRRRLLDSAIITKAVIKKIPFSITKLLCNSVSLSVSIYFFLYLFGNCSSISSRVKSGRLVDTLNFKFPRLGLIV